MKNLRSLLFTILVGINSITAYSQVWSTSFNGIDSIWNDLGGNPSINIIMNSENELYIGGAFQNVGTLPVNRIFKWDGDSCYNLGQGVTGAGGSPVCLKMFNNKLFMGGGFQRLETSQIQKILQFGMVVHGLLHRKKFLMM